MVNNTNVCVKCGCVGTYAKGLCQRCYKVIYRAEHKDELRLYEAVYHIEHKNEKKKYNRLYNESHKEERRLRDGSVPMSENKTCSSYLGVYIAERLLSNVFTNVDIMPYGNPGFDFKCGLGYKVDVKSSVLDKRNYWSFRIRRNTTADYFACLSFDNRDDLNLQHFHLIPGDVVNHLINFTYRPSTVYKWQEYEKPIDELLTCCDTMRSL